MFEVQEQRSWHDVVTLDQPWFDCSTDCEAIWLSPGEEIPERPRIHQSVPKWMVTIFWDPSGFHLIGVVLNGRKLNGNYYRREILEALSEWRRE
jgi:hypothetical protein